MEQQPNHPAGEQPGEEHEGEDPKPKVYIASLADYNAGRLHGAWIDAAQDPEELAAAAQTMLAASPTPFAEEYAIHDFEGFGPLRLSEYQSLETVSLVAQGIAEHGAVFAHWATLVDELTPDALNRFKEAYRGHHACVADYANELLEDLGAWRELEPQWLQPYLQIDVEGFARDLELSGDVLTSEGDDGVYIFEGGL